MKRVLLLGVALAVLVGSAAAWSSLDPLAAPSGVVALVGGGHWDAGTCFARNDGTPPTCLPFARDFSVDAHGNATGAAVGSILFGRNGSASPLVRIRVTCMTVAGNAAVVGGILLNGGQDFADAPAFLFVVDNGGPGGTFDRFGPLVLYTAGEPAPAGFPSRCGLAPSASPFGYTDLLAGDFSIHNGL